MQEALGVLHRIARIYIIHAGKTVENVLLITATSGAKFVSVHLAICNLKQLWANEGVLAMYLELKRKKIQQLSLSAHPARTRLCRPKGKKRMGPRGQLHAKQLFKEI